MDLVRHDLALNEFYRLWAEVVRRVGRVPDAIPPSDKIILHRHGVPQQIGVEEFADVLLDYFFSRIPLGSRYLTALVNLLLPKMQVAIAESLAASYAPLNSPAFVGVPTAPTAPADMDTTQLATTAFVQAAIAAALNPEAGGDLTTDDGSALLMTDDHTALLTAG